MPGCSFLAGASRPFCHQSVARNISTPRSRPSTQSSRRGSSELLSSLKLLRPRHLPLVVTIADRDLKAVVRESPENEREMFTQSVAEEIIHLREAALRLVESQGGLALDVTAAVLAPKLLETYLRVKERGLL